MARGRAATGRLRRRLQLIGIESARSTTGSQDHVRSRRPVRIGTGTAWARRRFDRQGFGRAGPAFRRITVRGRAGAGRVRYLVAREDRKSVVSGKSVSVRVDLGGRLLFKKKKRT